MIGDTMETDIRGATDLGFNSLLVLTGSTKRESLNQYPFRPTYVVDSVAELLMVRPGGELVTAVLASSGVSSSSATFQIGRGQDHAPYT